MKRRSQPFAAQGQEVVNRLDAARGCTMPAPGWLVICPW